MRALARLTYIHAWGILGIAAVLSALAAFAAVGVFDRVQPFDISDSGSEVARASAAVEASTGAGAEAEVILMVSPGAGGGRLSDLSSVAERLQSVPGIAKVVTPDSDRALISDRDTFLVLGYLEPGIGRVDAGEAVVDAFASDPNVLAGGTAVAAYQVGVRSEHDTRRIELYAAPILLLLLLVVFRTLVAAVLPLIVAGLSILLTMASLRLITDLTAIDLFSLQTVTGLGTGLAINYSLFILARYREELLSGGGYRLAYVNTMVKAGRTVAFSAITVAAALASLLVFPQPFLHSTGIAGGLVALFAGLIALFVLPASLALLGPSVNSFAIRRDPLRSGVTETSGFWRRLPAAVCRRPVPAILVGGAVMVALALQAGGATLNTPDARELPKQDSARKVASSVAGDFPKIQPTQLFALVPSPNGGRDGLEADLGGIQGLVAVSRPTELGDGTAEVSISGDMDPLSEDGQTFVSDIRDQLPEGSLVGGRAAEQADQRTSILHHIPAAVALIFLTNLLVLAVMTRSVLLPLLALAVNVLTVLASLGALSAVFTSDLLAGWLGTEAQSGIDISVPVISFAIAFGLSTDYGIFLLARIREERAAAADETDAIIEGVAATGRLISASAVLMAIAVGAFVFSDLVIVKEFAVAIAVAVLLDATIVRGLIIPASLKLLGRSAWWHPRSRRAGAS